MGSFTKLVRRPSIACENVSPSESFLREVPPDLKLQKAFVHKRHEIRFRIHLYTVLPLWRSIFFRFLQAKLKLITWSITSTRTRREVDNQPAARWWELEETLQASRIAVPWLSLMPRRRGLVLWRSISARAQVRCFLRSACMDGGSMAESTAEIVLATSNVRRELLDVESTACSRSAGAAVFRHKPKIWIIRNS